VAVEVARVELAAIEPLRALHMQELNAQVRYDAVHRRGWSDSYALTVDGTPAGYGSLMGDLDRRPRETVFEYYVTPPFRRRASVLFAELLARSSAKRIECQSNDPQLSAMLFEFASTIEADTILFEAHTIRSHPIAGATFRPRRDGDLLFEHADEPEGEYVVELEGDVVATGGFLLHYNEPFADVYMEVAAAHRRKGVGTFLVEGVLRECYAAGRVPAARTSVTNQASKATLTKAGLRPCGYMLKGAVPRSGAGQAP
jgi:GNAT superfamily N-acetyltransferase